MLSERDAPIIAIATPAGKGAVGVIRISGKNLRSYANGLCQLFLQPRYAHLVWIKDAEGFNLDQVLALFFPAPHSYTGEDILELQGHGGPVVLSMIVERCLAFAVTGSVPLPGLRRAMPGEFTQRAYLNNKIDLAQAEAVSDLIDAQTQAAVRGAGQSLVGIFSKEVDGLQARMMQIRMLVEASLDFPEEDIDFVEKADISSQLRAILSDVQSLCNQTRQGALLRDGMKMVIAGQPNAGKSSLLNALTGQETAIVTPIAGTTRDVISQTISIEGMPVHVIDTAGLRETDHADEVEKIGMSRAWAQIMEADVVLLMYDLSRMQEPRYVENQQILKTQMLHNKTSKTPLLHIFNKADLVNPAQGHKTEEPTVYISAKTGEGMDALRVFLLETVGWNSSYQESAFSARTRHVQALEAVKHHTEKALGHLQHKPALLDLLAEDLRCAQQQLSLLTGSMSADDLLGEIFSRFCIGK
jgi:tRNA modification GTPase